MNYRVLFPDRPQPDTDTLFGLGPAPANDKPDATETPSPSDGRCYHIPVLRPLVLGLYVVAIGACRHRAAARRAGASDSARRCPACDVLLLRLRVRERWQAPARWLRAAERDNQPGADRRVVERVACSPTSACAATACWCSTWTANRASGRSRSLSSRLGLLPVPHRNAPAMDGICSTDPQSPTTAPGGSTAARTPPARRRPRLHRLRALVAYERNPLQVDQRPTGCGLTGKLADALRTERRAPPPASASSTLVASRYGESALRSELERLLCAPIGSRNSSSSTGALSSSVSLSAPASCPGPRPSRP